MIMITLIIRGYRFVFGVRFCVCFCHTVVCRTHTVCEQKAWSLQCGNLCDRCLPNTSFAQNHQTMRSHQTDNDLSQKLTVEITEQEREEPLLALPVSYLLSGLRRP